MSSLSPSGAPSSPEEAPPPAPAPRAWPWWAAPAAVGLAFVLALVLGALAAVVLAVLGADPTADEGGAELVLVALQDVAFIAAPLVIAGMFVRPRPEQFGLVRTRPGRAVAWAALAMVAYLAFFAAWSPLVGDQEQDDLFVELGIAKELSVGLVLVALLVCVGAPVAEEFLFRGFVYSVLRPSLGVLGAALAVGAVFGTIHAPTTPPVLLVPLGVLGFVLCLLREKTGSLLPPIFLHALNNSVSFSSLVDASGGAFAGIVVGSLVVCGLVVAPFVRGRAPA